jgi:YidC/Oxa1 family membrane protein insertase
MGFIGEFFNLFLIDPMTNLFVMFTSLTGNAGYGVILLTLFIRFITFPLTLRQMHTGRMMALIGPRMQEINKKYKDPRRRSEESMKLYREAGINPLGCFSGMLLQFPILIALYQVFSVAVGETPEALIKVSNRLYDWSLLREGMPLPADFLWLHLGRPDDLLIIPILVAATTYILQKMTVMPTTDERMRAQTSMMNLLMPFMFGYIALSLPSGLGLYYVLANLIGMVMQYAYVGGGAFNWQGLIGFNQDPILPKALEVRQAQAERFSASSNEDSDGATVSSRKAGAPAKSSNGDTPSGETAAARRRRYANGRRRGRR